MLQEAMASACVTAGSLGRDTFRSPTLTRGSAPAHHRCVAADFGLMGGSAAALPLQACIYARHGLDGATVHVACR